MKNAATCLLIADDASAVAPLIDRAARAGVAETIVVRTLAAARRELANTRFDLVLAEDRLPDGDALSLLSRKRREDAAEYFLFGRDVSKNSVLSALRAGVRDVFEPPFEPDAAVEQLRDALKALRKRRHDRRRSKRLRDLSSRIIRDRREVRKRVDIVCRDLVSAYRQLAEKVVAMEERAGAPDDDTLRA